jgi:DNA-binding Lrp family transcriptional regulator
MEENKVAQTTVETTENKAKEKESLASKLLDEIVKENKLLTGPQMVEVEKRIGVSPSEGWYILDELRKAGQIMKYKTKDSQRAPVLYALPEMIHLIDQKKWTFEVKEESKEVK